MFRRILSLALVSIFFIATAVMAAKVSPDEVMTTAMAFLSENKSISGAEGVEHSILEITPFVDGSTKKILTYIAHLKPQGFIAISTDTNIKPVIAFSFRSNFSMNDDANDTFKQMLKNDMHYRQKKLSTLDKTTKKQNAKKWDRYLSLSLDDKEDGEASYDTLPLSVWDQWPADDDNGWLNTVWGQEFPYNERCPIVYTKPIIRCLTGGIGTGMGQIINYWRYPDSVVFYVEDNYYLETLNPDGYPIFIKARYASTTFPWPNLGPESIAQLLYACGISVQLEFNVSPDIDPDLYPNSANSPGSTGAIYYAAEAFEDRWDYSSADYMMALEIVGFEINYDADFFDILMNNMKAGRPALLGLKAGADEEPPPASTSTDETSDKTAEMTVEEKEEAEKAAYLKKFKFNPASDYVPNKIFVRFKSNVDPDSVKMLGGKGRTNNASVNNLMDKHNVRLIKKTFRNKRKIPRLNVFTLTIGKNESIEDVLDAFNKDPNVIYAEPVYIAHLFATPTDSSFDNQWAYQNIQAEDAWDLETGDSDIVIAIVDTGVDWDHPDLADNIWTNSGETEDGTDTDGNGYIDDIRGWDIVNDDNNPMDDEGHGSHCAGIAAAVTNNTTGLSRNVAGTAWNCRIMAVKSGDEYGYLTNEDVVEGIEYAADNGASIISMSFGGYMEDETVGSACNQAHSDGVFLVAAAGNENFFIDILPSYPAGHNSVMSVAATDQDDVKAYFSNYGSDVDISAPGVSILSTLWNNTYATWPGTSMACPFVAGGAGLLLSAKPSLTPDLVRFVLAESADNIDDENPLYVGLIGGRLNLYNALTYQIPYYGTVPVVCDGFREPSGELMMGDGEDDSKELTLIEKERATKVAFKKKFKFDPASDYVPDKIFVRFKSKVNPASVKLVGGKAQTNSAAINKLLDKYNVKAIKKTFRNVKKNPKKNVFTITVGANKSMQEILDEFNKHPDVVYAEPVYIYKPFATPTDDSFGDQWAYPIISAEDGWDIETGDASVSIAIIDSGVDWDHPDLAANIWSNDDEAVDSTDTDGNGYVDDVRGYDFVSDDNNPDDGYGHGSHVAGIAGAVTNNVSGLSENVAGTAWDCKIMPLKVSDSLGNYYTDAIVEAIEYAADNGASVINMSFGGPSPLETIETACDDAYDEGLLLVAAAGNWGYNADDWGLPPNPIIYPAAYDSVMAVAATDETDVAAYFTEYGDWVEICAPGYHSDDTTGILSTDKNAGYDNISGTSMASPFVAGAAGLMFSLHTDIEPYLVRKMLKDSADDIDALQDSTHAGKIGKRLNILAALEAEVPEGYYHLNFNKGIDDNPGPISEAWYDVVSLTDPESPLCIEEGIMNISPQPIVLSVTTTLTGGVKINDGAVQNLPIEINLDPSEPVKVEAVPDPYSVFSHWTGDFSGSSNPTWLTGCDINVTAEFDPDEGDPDGDGMGNYEEFVAGTDPEDPDSVFEPTGMDQSGGPSTITITWSSIDGKLYAVYYSNDEFGDLMSWTLAEEGIPASGTGTNVWTDDGSLTGSAPDTVPYRYYKVEVYAE